MGDGGFERVAGRVQKGDAGGAGAGGVHGEGAGVAEGVENAPAGRPGGHGGAVQPLVDVEAGLLALRRG